MAFSSVLQALDLLDSATVNGEAVAAVIRAAGCEEVEVRPVTGERGRTDVVRVRVPGSRGRARGGEAPAIGIVGRLGGIGARPGQIGMVSDADGAVTAIACAIELGRMRRAGDVLDGDVLIATHVCPDAPTAKRHPVPMMSAPVDQATMNREELDPAMEAILSVDTTRGNRVVNHRGIAVTPPVCQGWVLRPTDELLDILQSVTGRLPVLVPVTMTDITPYGNGLYHLNSMLQPATAAPVPVVGVALTAEAMVAGSATGASQPADIDQAVRFCLEVAKAFGRGRCRLMYREEWERAVAVYGSMAHLQTPGGGEEDR